MSLDNLDAAFVASSDSICNSTARSRASEIIGEMYMEITKLFTQFDRLHFDGKLRATGFKAFAQILYPIRPEHTLEDDGRISVWAVPSSGTYQEFVSCR